MSLSSPVPPRATVPLAWVMVVGLAAAGLGIGATAAYYDLRPGPSTGNVQITDDLNRTVQVPYDPARVAVLAPSVMDPMFRLGLRSHVVAVGCGDQSQAGLLDDFSPDQVSLWGLTASMCVQDYPMSDEELLASGPQLVLAATIDDIQDLEAFSTTYHIPVVVLQASTLGGILWDDELLGEIFGVGAGAAALNAELSGVLNHCQNVTNGLTDNGTLLPTVLLTYDLSSGNGYWTFGPSSFGESLIEFAGGQSISANTSYSYPVLSGEQVLADQPAVIIYGTGYGLNLSYYEGGQFWSDFNAVKDGNATGLNSNLFTEADPTMILNGLPALLAILHPPAP